ncbi:MAG: ABC transporter substrate-binding protein [Gammaproteobacteria bacterium]
MKLIRIIILLLYIPGVADARGDDPLDVIRGTTELIMVRFTEEPEIAADPGQLRMLVNESIVPNVDFTLLSRLTLGKHWRRASTAQRQRFTDEYRRLLIRTYSNSLTNYNGQAIEHRLLTTTAEVKKRNGAHPITAARGQSAYG